MAHPPGECDIRHVGDVLIVFRRLAAKAGAPQHAVTPGPEGHQAESEGRRGSDHPGRRGEARPGEVLRVRPKVVSPR